MSRSVYGIVNFAYLNIFWKDTFVKKLSIMETMASLGNMLGPLIGFVLNSMFGYYYPLFFFSFISSLTIITVLLVIPSDELIVYEEDQKFKLPLHEAMQNK